MAIASDSSPLIALARIKRLGFLKELYKEVVIPPVVKVECFDKDKANGAQDAYKIERESPSVVGFSCGHCRDVSTGGGDSKMKKEELVAARLPQPLIKALEKIEEVEQSDRSSTLRKLLSRAVSE